MNYMERLTRAMSRHKSLLDLPPTQLRLLVFLLQQECEPLLLTELTKKLKVPKADASKDLHALRALHFVRIQLISERSPDGRLTMQPHFFLDADFLLKGARTAYRKRGPKTHAFARAAVRAAAQASKIAAAQAKISAALELQASAQAKIEAKAADVVTVALAAARHLAATQAFEHDQRGVYRQANGKYAVIVISSDGIRQRLGTFDKLSDAVATREEFRNLHPK